MRKNQNSATTGKPITARQASGGQGASTVPQAPGPASVPDQLKIRQASTPVQPSKTYVGVIVYIDVDGTIKPERIALGNRLFGISNIATVKDAHDEQGSDNLIRDYTVEIWNGAGKTKTSHLFMERTTDGIRWFVMQKAKTGTSV